MKHRGSLFVLLALCWWVCASASAASTAATAPASRCGDVFTAIAAVQGVGPGSPLEGRKVAVEGVVTATFQGHDQLGGYFIQQADADRDADPRSPEGLFVRDRRVGVAVGDRVRVRGKVADYHGATQLQASAVKVCAGGRPLPAAIPLRLPLADKKVLAALAGMRVTLPQTLTVTAVDALGRYGQLRLAEGRLYAATQLAAPGAPARLQLARNALNQLVLDDGSNREYPEPVPFLAPANTLRAGDSVSAIVGVVHYAFGEYRVLPTRPPRFARTNPRPPRPALPAAPLRVASFNTQNFFNGDGHGGAFPAPRGAHGAAEFARQKDKIVSALRGLDADIIGLTELENDGYGPASAIAQLVAALNSAGGDYAFIEPGAARLGRDAIAVGFIYRRSGATPVGRAAILDARVDARFGGQHRPALAQTFRDRRGGVLTVVVNHLKSKRPGCAEAPDRGDGQGSCAVARAAAARALAAWLAGDPTGSGDPDVLIVGDLNAYAREEPLQILAAAGYTDLLARFAGPHPYTFIFNGQAGYLDHALASPSLLQQVSGAGVWHINADEPALFDYHGEGKSARLLAALYEPGPYRSSDHDPVLVALTLRVAGAARSNRK